MSKSIPSITLADRVRAAVRKLGVCTNRQVLKEVSDYISASKAATAARRKLKKRIVTGLVGYGFNKRHFTTKDMVESGKLILVNEALCNLADRRRSKVIIRVERGVYCLNPRNGK